MQQDGIGSRGVGLNNSNEVVVDCLTLGEESFACLYSSRFSANSINIANLVKPTSDAWKILDVNAINDAGQITGYGEKNGVRTGFLATPHFRQADGGTETGGTPTTVPASFGGGNGRATSNTQAKGCALCSAASAVRSLIALDSLPPDNTALSIMTPAALNQRLLGVQGFSNNDLDFIAVSDLASLECIPRDDFAESAEPKFFVPATQ